MFFPDLHKLETISKMENQQQLLGDMIELVWGSNIQPELFQRWCQGTFQLLLSFFPRRSNLLLHSIT